MQKLAYSTYFSLKYLSGQGCLFQESHFTIHCMTDLSWVDKRTGTHDVKKMLRKLERHQRISELKNKQSYSRDVRDAKAHLL